MNKHSISRILNELKKLGCSQRAVRDKAYHKSQREHWGVPAPICNQFICALSKQFPETVLLQLAESLWKTNLFDPMICSAKILSYSKILPSEELWRLLTSFLKQVDGWALEDSLCPAAWKCVLKDKTLLDDIEKWTIQSNFWMRRAALVYTLPFAKSGENPERILNWAAGYVADPEWFIQKAIGWWLRVLGTHNPERVISFLHSHWPYLKTVAKREALRKLSADWQEKMFVFAQSQNAKSK